jgi:DNA-directed RNA polymerase II subunit RPB1
MDAEIYAYDDKTRAIQAVDFTILGNEEIKRMSALGKDTTGIDIPDLYDNMEPKRGGLIDTRLGTTNMHVDCATCGLNYVYCNGHLGHIDLEESVFHMGYINVVKKVLSCICLRCSKLLIYKNEKEIADILKIRKGRNRLTEVRNIAKNITYCQKANYGCGAPVSKIKIDIKKSTGTINIISETNLTNLSGDEEALGMYDGKKKIRQILTPDICYDLLKNISDTDCRVLGFDPEKSRPEDMIHKVFPVPPVQVRPSAKIDFLGSSTMEDDLTHKLADIVKANVRIRRYKESLNESGNKYGLDHTQLLQYHIATYYNNDTLSVPKAEQKGKQIKSISARLKTKEGRIRGNLMGKRVDGSARTVITPDPSLDFNQLGVPKRIAQIVTFPEMVTPANLDRLAQLVKRGRDNYPGANFVFQIGGKNYNKPMLPIDLRYRKEKIDLQYGDIVERHIVNGDRVLLNRQPTLHKLSMMGHRIKVIDDDSLSTFRLNVSVTTPYNADFDKLEY